MHTSNFEKHTEKNPISKFFLDNFYKKLLSQLQNLHPETILDVGAGEGFTLQKLKDRGIGKRLEGIEYLDEAIEIAKKLHTTITIKKGNIYTLPYGNNSFDVVICTEVLEHLDDPEKGLSELVRVTKRSCVLSVPNEPLFTIQRFFRGKNLLQLGDHPEHIQHWSKKSFEEFVSTKLKIVTTQTPIPWTLIVGEKD